MDKKIEEKLNDVCLALEKLCVELADAKSKENKPLPKEKIAYSAQDLMEIFGISRQTLGKWRNEGIIGYSLIGGTYYYTHADVQKVMEKTHQDPFYNFK